MKLKDLIIDEQNKFSQTKICYWISFGAILYAFLKAPSIDFAIVLGVYAGLGRLASKGIQTIYGQVIPNGGN